MERQSSLSATMKLMIFASGLLAILLLTILIIQLRAINHGYAYNDTTGGETQCVYSLWKVQEGHPLYAWPNKEFYQFTIYNFGFYRLYASILSLLGAHGPELMLQGRYLTLVFALMGALIQSRLLFFFLRESKSRALAAAIYIFSFCVWFNSCFPGYFDISLRPDMLAVAVSMVALYCFLRYTAAGNIKWICAASLVWSVVWCIKQADVACIFGAGVYLLASRKLKAAVILSIVFAIPTGLVLALGSAEYRFNILVAPSANGLTLSHCLHMFLQGACEWLFPWTFAITLPWYLSRKANEKTLRFKTFVWDQMRPGTPLAPIIALGIIVLSGSALSLVALAKKGSNLNQMFEIFVAANILAFVLVLRLAALLPAIPARRFRTAVCLVLLSMCAWPAAQLVLNRLGPFTRLTDADLARKESFAAFLKTLKKPLYIWDEIYSLPWHATDNRYPAINPDPIFYDDAKARGMIKGGIEELIQNHWFSSIIVPTNSPLCAVALGAHYQREALPPDKTRFLDVLNQETPPCALFIAPDENPPVNAPIASPSRK